MDDAAQLRALSKSIDAAAALNKPGMQEAIARLLGEHRPMVSDEFVRRIAETSGLADIAAQTQENFARSDLGKNFAAQMRDVFEGSALSQQVADNLGPALADLAAQLPSWESIAETAEVLARVDRSALEDAYATAEGELRDIEREVIDEPGGQLSPISLAKAAVYSRIAVAIVLVMLFHSTDFEMSQATQATLDLALELLGLVPMRHEDSSTEN